MASVMTLSEIGDNEEILDEYDKSTNWNDEDTEYMIDIAKSPKKEHREKFACHEYAESRPQRRNAPSSNMRIFGTHNGSKYEPLPSQVQKEYVRLAQEGDSEAKHALITSYQRYIYSVARKIGGQHHDMADLMQDGNIELMRCIDGFDPAYGTQFSTFACGNIALRLKSNFTRAMKKRSKAKISIDAADDEGNKTYFEIFDYREPTPIQRMIQNERTMQAHSWMSHTHPEGAEVLELCFGLNDGIERTDKEVSEIVGKSRQRVGIIRERALTDICNVFEGRGTTKLSIGKEILHRTDPKAESILGLSLGLHRNGHTHTYEEIAKRVGCTVLTVRTTLDTLRRTLPKIMGLAKGNPRIIDAIDNALSAKHPEPLSQRLRAPDREMLFEKLDTLADITNSRNVNILRARIGTDDIEHAPLPRSTLAGTDTAYGLSETMIKRIEREVRQQLNMHMIMTDQTIPANQRIHIACLNYVLRMRASRSKQLLARILDADTLFAIDKHFNELNPADREILTRLTGMDDGIEEEHTAYAKDKKISEATVTHREHIAWQALAEKMNVPYYRSHLVERLHHTTKSQSAEDALKPDEVAEVKSCLEHVGSKFKMILSQRYGMNGSSDPRLLTDIGKEMGISKKHVHALLRKGLRKLDSVLKPSTTAAELRSTPVEKRQSF